MPSDASSRLLPRSGVMRSGGDPDEATPPGPQLPRAGAGRSKQEARCSCGHGKRAHEHYRKGRDCALCACPRFRRRGLIRLFRG